MRNRRGGIALATALAAIPLIAAAGLAIDGARAWLVSSRLQASLDAAALAGARNLNVTRTARDAEIRAMFWANFSAAIPDPLMPDRRLGFLGSSTETPLIRDRSDDPDLADTALQISVNAVVPTTFMRIFGIDSVRVAASAQARRADMGMELALVLDVTGSMGRNYRPNSTGLRDFDTATNIHALRLASQDLINSLYGNRTVVDGLWVSVVPYTTTVNIGTTTARRALVDFSRITATTTDGRTTFGFAGENAYGPAGWAGCIEARHLDRTLEQYEAPPIATRLTPFFWHSTLRNNGNMQVRPGTNNPMPGDNDWIRALAGPGGSNNVFAITERWRAARENFSVGPNLGCPEDEILPLEASRDVILDRLRGLRSTNRGGTMANVGLQAALWTLSPLWRDVWNLGPAPQGQDTALPLDYGAPFMRKVIVLMTDGVNEWFDYPQGWPGVCDDTNAGNNAPASGLNRLPGVANSNIPPFSTQPCPTGYSTSTDGQNNADYTGYGRLRDNRLGTNLTNAQARDILNARMLELCNIVKSRGITIYTITFNLANANTQNLFRDCATSPDFYFNSPTQADLRAAFQTIGSQLANLRLTQ